MWGKGSTNIYILQSAQLKYVSSLTCPVLPRMKYAYAPCFYDCSAGQLAQFGSK